MNTVGFSTTYDDDSDADDEYERSAIGSPVGAPPEFEASPTDDESVSNEHTPTTFTHPQDGQSPGIGPLGQITEWSAESVADFFSNLGIDDYEDVIIDEAINGDALIAMNHEELKELGVSSVGHRLTILKAVYDLKLKQGIPIEPDNYVPPSADTNAPDAKATQDDIARIINALKLRDERIMAAEADLRMMKDELYKVVEENKRLREDTLPLIRKIKDQSQPLPQPGDEFATEQPNSPHPSMFQDKARLSRKGSTKKLYTGSQPTIHEVGNDLDPSAAAIAASSSLTSSSLNGSNQASPTSPAYLGGPRSFSRNDASTASRVAQPQAEEQWPWPTSATQDRSSSNPPLSARRPPTSAGVPAATNPPTPAEDTPGPVSAAMSSEKPSETFKSFRVSMDDPCHKVLPAALKKYKIEDDWRQYSLYIVYGDQERCLGWDERPLILFKQLYREEKKPMFMLRKHAAPAEGFTTTAASAPGGARTSVGPGGRAGGVQFPGGVF